MELKNFIAQSLSQIAEGVKLAQDRSAELDARINPFLGSTGRSRKVIDVKFQVAVSSATGTATQGSIGVLAGIVGLKSAGQSKQDMEAATTISFEVPMILPTEADKTKHPKPVAPAAPRRNTFVSRR